MKIFEYNKFHKAMLPKVIKLHYIVPSLIYIYNVEGIQIIYLDKSSLHVFFFFSVTQQKLVS